MAVDYSLADLSYIKCTYKTEKAINRRYKETNLKTPNSHMGGYARLYAATRHLTWRISTSGALLIDILEAGTWGWLPEAVVQ